MASLASPHDIFAQPSAAVVAPPSGSLSFISGSCGDTTVHARAHARAARAAASSAAGAAFSRLRTHARPPSSVCMLMFSCRSRARTVFRSWSVHSHVRTVVVILTPKKKETRGGKSGRRRDAAAPPYLQSFEAELGLLLS